MASVGVEVEKHCYEVEVIVRRIMLEHTQRKGCAWRRGAVEAIIRDLTDSIERQEICEEEIAA